MESADIASTTKTRRPDPMGYNTKLEMEIASLGGLHRSELAERWRAIYGVPPPKGARRVLLERAIAWHVQAKLFGGLRKETLRELLKGPTGHARSGPKSAGLADSDALAGIDINAQSKQRAIRPLPSPGARLVRDWRGKTHVIDVVKTGYVWQGKSHKSLSVIAREITGARWSGPRFFGL
jgi:hypothetical protein